MEATWHLIQYTADMRRKEPRNVGVAVEVDGQWAVRMFAVDPLSRSVDGRALRKFGLSKEGYSAWVEYYTDMILAGRWERILRVQQRRASEFRLTVGGHMRATGSANDVATRLFADLVHRSEEHSEPRAHVLRSNVEQVF